MANDSRHILLNDDDASRPKIAVWLGLLLAVLASRLGFVGAGFGTDPDAHRLAIAARAIRDTGAYVFSREPGHPVQEFLAALLVPFGPVGLNGATVVMSVVVVAFFERVVAGLGVRHPFWLAMGVAFCPLFWIHSVDSMDFVWAMAFGWFGVWLAFRGRIHWAGVALGLAIGCRITEGLTLIPAVLLCGLGASKDPSDGGKAAGAATTLGARIRLGFLTLVVGVACYLPVALVYGVRALRVYETGRVPWSVVWRRWWLEPWGVPGACGLALALLLGALSIVRATSKPNERASMHDTTESPRFVTSGRRISAAIGHLILGHWILFLRLPHDAGYLLSTVPWILLLVGLKLPRLATPIVVTALVLSNVPVAPLDAATVWGAHERRRIQLRTVRRWIGDLRRQTEPMVLVAGTYQPKLLSELGEERLSAVEIRYLLREEEARRAMEQGKQIRFLKRALDQNRNVAGLDLLSIGARPFGGG